MIFLMDWQRLLVSETYPVIAVVAGRQAGKTTAARAIYESGQGRGQQVGVLCPNPTMYEAFEKGLRPPGRGSDLLDILIVDEAAFVHETEFWPAYGLLKHGGRVVLLSTMPDVIRGSEGWFWNLIHDRRKLAHPIPPPMLLAVPTAVNKSVRLAERYVTEGSERFYRDYEIQL